MKTKVTKGEVRALETKYICFAILLRELITHPSVCGDQVTSNDLLKPRGSQVLPQNLARAHNRSCLQGGTSTQKLQYPIGAT